MDLQQQKKFVESAQTWFDGKLKSIILDNRRRYRMQTTRSEERRKLGLSNIPSTKTTATIDRYVERALIEYHQDPEAISFTSTAVGDTQKDQWASWLTSIFRYRANNPVQYFDFFNWNQSSLLAGAADGFECALVRWERQAYNEEITEYAVGSQPVDKAVFDQYSAVFPEMFVENKVSKPVVSVDTWWIDQLEPGKDVIWDPNIPLLDVNLGQFCMVRLRKSPDDVKNMAEIGILDKSKVTDEVLRKFQNANGGTFFNQSTVGTNNYTYRADRTVDNPEDVNLQEMNPVELCCVFFRQGNRWMCQFNLGMQDLVSDPKPVDDVWFGGRKVNRLPVVVGVTKLKLWERVGRAIPETIAPIEDEHIDHKNNVNDAAKIAIQGRWRVDPDADIEISDLLNRRVFRADRDTFEKLDERFDVITTLRADDLVQQEINELVPSGVMGAHRNVAGKGSNKTLGQTQLGLSASDEKMGVSIVTRNNTFLKKVLWLIAQLEMAFETDEVVLKVAGSNANIQVPQVMTPQGRSIIDISVLDFCIDVQINAGLGSAPRYQKADMTMQLVDWGLTHKIRVDAIEGFKQLSVLAGYSPEQLLDKNPPPPPKPEVDYKVNLSLTLQELLALSPTAAMAIEQKLLSGEASVTASVDEPKMKEARQNGGGFMQPDRTGTVVNGTDDAAVRMSEGGQIGGLA